MNEVRITNTAWSTVRNLFELRTETLRADLHESSTQRGISVLRLPDGTIRITVMSATDGWNPNVAAVFLTHTELAELMVALTELSGVPSESL